MKYEKGTFVIVPNLERLDVLPALGQALFVWLCKYADQDGICFPSRKKLAGHLSCDIRTIDKHLGFLEELGFISKTKRQKEGTKENMSNLYQIQMIRPVEEINRHPSEDIVATPSEPNVPVTISNNNSIHLTQVMTSGQLPPNRGKTYILRLLSIYKDLFRNKYGFDPTVNLPRFAKSTKSLLETKTELQAAAMMICFFDWSGNTGDDSFQRQKLLDASHNFSWFFSTVNQYESYLRNVYRLKMDDEEEVREFVGKNMMEIKK